VSFVRAGIRQLCKIVRLLSLDLKRGGDLIRIDKRCSTGSGNPDPLRLPRENRSGFDPKILPNSTHGLVCIRVDRREELSDTGVLDGS
jgi:hypothetical protein